MSIFNRAYLYIIRKKIRSSILFLIVTLISFFLLSGSVLNTTVGNISKNLYKDVNFGFYVESLDKSNKEIEKDTLKKINDIKGVTQRNYLYSKSVSVVGAKAVQENQNITFSEEMKNKSNLLMMNGITSTKNNIDFKNKNILLFDDIITTGATLKEIKNSILGMYSKEEDRKNIKVTVFCLAAAREIKVNKGEI